MTPEEEAARLLPCFNIRHFGGRGTACLPDDLCAFCKVRPAVAAALREQDEEIEALKTMLKGSRALRDKKDERIAELEKQCKNWHEPHCSAGYPHNAPPGAPKQCNCGVWMRQRIEELEGKLIHKQHIIDDSKIVIPVLQAAGIQLKERIAELEAILKVTPHTPHAGLPASAAEFCSRCQFETLAGRKP